MITTFSLPRLCDYILWKHDFCFLQAGNLNLYCTIVKFQQEYLYSCRQDQHTSVIGRLRMSPVNETSSASVNTHAISATKVVLSLHRTAKELHTYWIVSNSPYTLSLWIYKHNLPYLSFRKRNWSFHAWEIFSTWVI